MGLATEGCEYDVVVGVSTRNCMLAFPLQMWRICPSYTNTYLGHINTKEKYLLVILDHVLSC